MTPQQRKQQFINRGESVRAWAEDNGFDPKKDLAAVYRVLNGQSPARRGKHHEIYVGDPMRSAPEKLKTILRHPVEKIDVSPS